jgi:hypothetical protein
MITECKRCSLTFGRAIVFNNDTDALKHIFEPTLEVLRSRVTRELYAGTNELLRRSTAPAATRTGRC